jgi:hypothetical protein
MILFFFCLWILSPWHAQSRKLATDMGEPELNQFHWKHHSLNGSKPSLHIRIAWGVLKNPTARKWMMFANYFEMHYRKKQIDGSLGGMIARNVISK